MEHNLKINAGYKDLLLKKLSFAVISNVLSQFLLLTLFLLIINVSILHPFAWLNLTLGTLVSVNTWLHLIPLSSIIFAQSIICAKDYVVTSTSCLTRFQKLCTIFSARLFILGFLHVLIGGLIVVLYLSLAGGQYENLFVLCNKGRYCLVEGTLFIVLCGMWTGFYFFARVYISGKSILFPVIQQHKLLQFKNKLIPLFRESKSAAILPTVYFFGIYNIWGKDICYIASNTLKIYVQHEPISFLVYLYCWLLATFYFFNMSLMKFFFELYLTEHVEFPIVGYSNQILTLSDAIIINKVPVIQHLACLDLYTLSLWSAQRREILFTLSQPGGHPHNWNYLIQNATKLLTHYTAALNKSVDNIMHTENDSKSNRQQITEVEQSNKDYKKYESLRNMSLSQHLEPINIINLSHNQTVSSVKDAVAIRPTKKLSEIVSALKKKLGFQFLFGNLPEATIQECLKNGQIIVWIVEGISNIAVASLNEDSFGVVQKDLPLIITNLVELKKVIEKLNKVPLFVRKDVSYLKLNFSMISNIHSTVKRSLFNICWTFGKYFNDLPLSEDIYQHMPNYINK